MKTLTIPLVMMTAQALLAAPSNDLIQNAEPLEGDKLAVTANNESAGAEVGDPLGFRTASLLGPLIDRSVWYTWRAPSAGVLFLDTAGSAFDTALAVFAGENPLNLRALATSDNTALGDAAALSIPTARGTQYFICVGSSIARFDQPAGDLKLSLSFTTVGGLSPVAGSDDFSHRLRIEGSEGRGLASSYYAIEQQPGEPNIAQGGGTVWWEWVAPVDGIVAMDTRGSDFGSLLTLFSGETIDQLSLVSQSAEPATATTASVKFRARRGLSYKICVSGHAASLTPPGAIGNVVLNLAQQPDPDPALRISPAVQIEANTQSGVKYQLQQSASLTEWEDVDAPFVGDGQVKTWCFRVTGAIRHIYRLKTLED